MLEKALVGTKRYYTLLALLTGVFALGFLFYSVINAAGFYGQRGETPFLVMFIVIFILAVVFTVPAFRSRAPF